MATDLSKKDGADDHSDAKNGHCSKAQEVCEGAVAEKVHGLPAGQENTEGAANLPKEKKQPSAPGGIFLRIIRV